MTGATPWWGTVLIAAITAVAALGGTGISTWRQNRRAGREEWFRRVQWAENLAATKNDDERAAAGYRVLEALSDSPLATGDDKRFLLQLANAGNDQGIVHSDDSLDEIEFATDTGEDTSQEAT